MLMLPKTPVVHDRKYLDWIREQPCVLSGQSPSDPAHIRIGGGGGMGMKPSDDRVLPLAHHLHAEQHQVGELTFWRDAFAMNDRLLIEAIIAMAEKRYRQWQSR